MSTVIRLNGVTLPGTGYLHISQFLEIFVSVTDGLKGMYSFTESEEKSLINYAGGQNLIKYGNPVFTPDGIKVSRQNYFDTGIMPSGNGFTHVIVAIPKKDIPVGEGVFIISNYFKPGGTGNGGENSAYALTEIGNARWRNYVQVNSAGVVYADMGVSALSDTEPAIWGGVTSIGSGSTGGNKVFYGFNNNLAIGTAGNVSTINIAGQGTKLIGGHRGPADFFTLESNYVQAVLIYDRALSNDELNQVYHDLRQYGAGRGIAGL
ncbi:hypothetical protein QZQ06_10420 [Serratia marcescens]|uniref:hypothetical protein n=1 Tax=Serratia TaxID=613 RepID=UPI0018D921A3|nr:MULTISPECIES: hypothetical protein [Serratia]EIV2912406.1 hypothetical protein [Serratia marcescens]MBH2533883.1 hypothetical protein [Serratia marcescens]MDH7588582.1 hypothetical protein [Serratia bockelmannii]MDP8650115.1 hypothetical protein [Serratia marcescens]MDP8664968.1 hypothetical protein [Serratia marcescens]